MNFVHGLQYATRNCVFSRFNLLTNWRKYNALAVTSLDCNQAQMNHIVNKYQGLRVDQRDGFTSLPGNFNFCRTFNNKRTVYPLRIKSKDIWLTTRKCAAWSDSFSRQKLTEEVAVVPALSVLHPVNCFPTRDIRSFHTSPCFRAAPVPLLLIILKPVQKLLAIIVGRGIRKWWRALPPNKKELFKESVRKNKWKLFLGLSSFGLLFVVFYFTHLEVSPITGRTKLLLLGKEHFSLLSELECQATDYTGDLMLFKNANWDKDLQIHSLQNPPFLIIPRKKLSNLLVHMPKTLYIEWKLKWYFQNILVFSTLERWMEEYKNDMLTENDAQYLTIKEVFYHLIECNKDIPGISEVNWIIHVVDSPDVNAFVLPNGHVFVFTGLINVSDIHQLSFILGHEIAHAVLEHAAEKASVVHLLDFLGLIFLTMIWAVCPRDSLAILGQWLQSKLQEYLFSRPYSRTLEAEADKIGLQIAAKACVDVRASMVFWQQMELADSLSGHPRLPEWLSTHPSHGNRVENLGRLIPEALKIREICNCPPLSGPDPRLVFKLTMKHFLEESEKEDPNSTVKKQKVDTLPIQEQKQIQLT